MRKTGRMRQVMARMAFKGLAVFIGILVISTVLEFMTWCHGREAFIELRGSQMSGAYPAPGRDEAISGDELNRVNEWLDSPFIPDPWPFDNVSFWHKTEEREQE